jgi:hypothetical protein
MNQKIKRVQINKDILSYTTAVKGNWVFKTSVYQDKQILMIGMHQVTGDFFTKMFVGYEEVMAFLDFLAHRDSDNGNFRKLDFPEL